MASKKESSFVNLVVVLFLVSAIAATALAFVFQATEEPIALARSQKEEQAIKKIVPPFDNKPYEERYYIKVSDKDSITVYPAKKGEELAGYAVKTFSDEGFSGRISIMVGFDKDGKIGGTIVLDHKETPGLGDKMAKSKTLAVIENEDGSSDTTWWSKQFIGKKPEFTVSESDGKTLAMPVNIKVSKDGGEVDAITASTITSRAFCNAVNRAYTGYNEVGELQGKPANNTIHYVLFIFLAFGVIAFIFSKLKF